MEILNYFSSNERKARLVSYPDLFCFTLRLQYCTLKDEFMPPTPELFTIPIVVFLKYCLCLPVVEIRRAKLRFLASKTISSSA